MNFVCTCFAGEICMNKILFKPKNKFAKQSRKSRIQSIASLTKSLVKNSKHRKLNKVVSLGFKASRAQQSRKLRIQSIASLTKSLVKDSKHHKLNKVVSKGFKTSQAQQSR